MSAHASSARAHAATTVFLVGWALTPVFVRYMRDAYDPYTQALLRYASAAAALAIYSLLFHRREYMQALRAWRILLPMAFLVTGMQLAWTVALYHTTATMGQLVTTLQTPMVILLSFAVFREERAVIRHPGYFGGTLLCMAGLVGVFMREEGGSARIIIDYAMVLLLFVSLAWSVYAVWGRHTAKELHPVAMFTVISMYVSLGFVAIMLLFGRPETLPGVDPYMHALAFISGVTSIAAGHCAFHYAQIRLGSAYCTSIQLITPFLTHVIALAIWPDESLIWIQWTGGIMLIGGGFLVVNAWRETDRRKAP